MVCDVHRETVSLTTFITYLERITEAIQRLRPVRTKSPQNEKMKKIVFREINTNSWLLLPQNIIINEGGMLMTMIKAVCRFTLSELFVYNIYYIYGIPVPFTH